MLDPAIVAKRKRVFKFILSSVIVLNIAFFLLHWGTVLFLEATGAGILALILFPVFFADIIVSAFTAVLLLVSIVIYRPSGRYLVLGLATLLLVGGYALFSGVPAYKNAIEGSADQKELGRIISRDEGLKYFEQCRVHEMTQSDSTDMGRSGVGGLSVARGEGEDYYGWWHSFDMRDYEVFRAANFANFATCKPPLYPDVDGLRRMNLDTAISLLNQCRFKTVMYWTDYESVYGFAWKVADEFDGIAYGYESHPTVLFAIKEMAIPVRDAAQKAREACPDLQVVENYPISSFRR